MAFGSKKDLFIVLVTKLMAISIFVHILEPETDSAA